MIGPRLWLSRAAAAATALVLFEAAKSTCSEEEPPAGGGRQESFTFTELAPEWGPSSDDKVSLVGPQRSYSSFSWIELPSDNDDPWLRDEESSSTGDTPEEAILDREDDGETESSSALQHQQQPAAQTAMRGGARSLLAAVLFSFVFLLGLSWFGGNDFSAKGAPSLDGLVLEDTGSAEGKKG